jgi:hypothetical protein
MCSSKHTCAPSCSQGHVYTDTESAAHTTGDSCQFFLHMFSDGSIGNCAHPWLTQLYTFNHTHIHHGTPVYTQCLRVTYVHVLVHRDTHARLGLQGSTHRISPSWNLAFSPSCVRTVAHPAHSAPHLLLSPCVPCRHLPRLPAIAREAGQAGLVGGCGAGR